MKKYGFTLAEILITFVVIGVVAVMAIPLFIEAKQDKETTAKLSLAQTILANATEIAAVNQGKITKNELANYSSQEIFDIFYKKNIKTANSCSEDNSETCWTQTKDFFQKNIAPDGNKYGIAGTVHTGFTMQDGMNVTLTKVKELDERFGIETKDEYSVVFMVDTNGNKEPNAIGQDVFAFVLDSQGKIIPAGSHNDSSNCQRGCDFDDDYWDCTARVLKEGKRKYL